MSTLWSADITAIGPDASDMIDGGVVILFGEPVPEALAEVSIVHRTTTAPTRCICCGRWPRRAAGSRRRARPFSCRRRC